MVGLKAGKIWNLLVVGVAVCSLGGCYNPNAVRNLSSDPYNKTPGVEYRVAASDVLVVWSESMREFTPRGLHRGITSAVKRDGEIHLPLLGDVQVAGKTASEIEQILTQTSRKYYTQGQLNARVLEHNSRKFYVFGEVHSPGAKAWTGRQTLLDAVAKSYPTPAAWGQRIILIRKNPQQQKVVINLDSMIYFGDMSGNVPLMPDDVIYVQLNPFARFGRWLQNMIAPAVPTPTPAPQEHQHSSANVSYTVPGRAPASTYYSYNQN